MQISVTQENIAQGDPRSTHSCPIALAMINAMPHIAAVHVSHQNIIIYEDLPLEADFVRETAIPISNDLHAYINSVDYNESPQPTTFNIDIEQSQNRTIYKHHVSPTLQLIA